MSDDPTLFIIVVLVVSAIVGALGAYVANEKGRDPGEGFALGFFFNIPGVIIEACLPTKAIPVPPAPRPVPAPYVPSDAEIEAAEARAAQAHRDQVARRKAQQALDWAEEVRILAENQARKVQREADAKARQRARKRFYASGTGQTLSAILIGLTIAAPLALGTIWLFTHNNQPTALTAPDLPQQIEQQTADAIARAQAGQ